ncbi:hypothetical protein GALL_458600 [mine drainage metagenome]|uniref:Uncharacterized protein n=1 Tax=mine drainage metagenome TaxID=410659 RepID=A0A1J5PNZ5_9ZZZZ
MKHLIWAAPFVVAACVAPMAVVPVQAKLSDTHVAVTMSDGAICTADKTKDTATPTGWAGTFQNCGHPMKYEVSLDARHNLLQGLFYGVFGLIGLNGALAPNGQVRVENGAGEVRVFTSPPPVNWH